jgi:hypothetical protein
MNAVRKKRALCHPSCFIGFANLLTQPHVVTPPVFAVVV